MLLVPATMELLGDANWWLPKWLDRLLPKISIEEGNETPAANEPTPDAPDDRELIDA
jgi:RND superfamily putative drug exporter